MILLEGVARRDDAGEVATPSSTCCATPSRLSTGHEVVATLSIGVALSERGKSREDLLHDADQAMYRAKESGRGGHVAMFGIDRTSRDFHEPSRSGHRVPARGRPRRNGDPLPAAGLVDRSPHRRRRSTGALERSRPRDPLAGPVHHAGRTQRHDRGLEQMVLEQACRQAKTWHREFGATLQISVNVSALHIQQRNLAEHVASVLESTGLEPSQLCLEISESVAMHDVVLTSSILGELHALGTRMAIDDFGTGHSSFGYLARFPFDVVKIDQSFVHGIEIDAVKSAIVSAVVALAKTIGAMTVAEGVEIAGAAADAGRTWSAASPGLLLRAAHGGGGFRQDAHRKRRRGPPTPRFGPGRLSAGSGARPAPGRRVACRPARSAERSCIRRERRRRAGPR